MSLGTPNTVETLRTSLQAKAKTDQIEAQGIDRWLGKLRKELVAGTYTPMPLLRVWITKSNGGQRPLGIPTIRDRVVQMAVVLVIGPIFEADLLPQQYWVPSRTRCQNGRP